ncbi:VOC family protein [Anaerostipes sp.]|uniref:VOC family protein n=1 Tax=Anaerostipes sp. TaxID=1872530 RepID=UPI0025B7B7F9|nr:VOC family protein [Anaerostipes sp.]MBS7008705.1 VOC family protein [Anaerostipes sp.]
MKFNETTIRILVRKNYGECFDFYTEKIGLTAVWGDRNGPYTSFAVSRGMPPCFAIFAGENMSMFQGYEQPNAETQPDTIAAVIPTHDLDGDYLRLKEAGVTFLGEPQYIEDWGMRCTYFRDPEGNLFELNDASSV